MAPLALPTPASAAGSESVERRYSAPALLLAAAMPLVFFHVRYLPAISVPFGGTSASVTAADIAIGCVAAAAIWAAATHGVACLRASLPLWISASLLFLWIGFGVARDAGEPEAAEHLVTALKFAEYAVLALTVPLIARRADDLKPLFSALVAWSAIASSVAVLQFVGTPIFDGWKAGWRQPSFLGHHDLAALSATVTIIGCAALVSRGTFIGGRWFVSTALCAGVVGLVLSGSVVAGGGVTVGIGVLALVGRARFGLDMRRGLSLVALCIVMCAGIVALRADPLASFLRFVGVRDNRPAIGVESYSQRTVLSYIGLRIVLDHPVVGVGWERSGAYEVFAPYLPDARKRFPDVVAEAFPSAERELGIQNAYIQTAADLGVIGLGLLLAVFASGLVLAIRAARYASAVWAEVALVALSGTIAVIAIWTAIGIVAGIPLEATTWLVLGLAAAAAAAPSRGAVDG